MVQIISPHIDDALLSIGGTIINLVNSGMAINIHYIFSMSSWSNPDALGKVYSSDVDEITLLRKKEEKAIQDKLHYLTTFHDFPDSQVRNCTNELGNASLVGNLYACLEDIVRVSELNFFPIGIAHPDHQIIGDIGRQLMRDGLENIIFYEDLPYAAGGVYKGNSLSPILNVHHLESKLVPIVIETKLEILKKYTSQVSPIWLSKIRAYAMHLRNGGTYERIWSREKDVFELFSTKKN